MGLFSVKIGWTRLAIFHIGSLQNNTIYTASGFFKRFRMTDSRTVFITKQKEEAQELIDSFKDKSKYDILGITWREQNLWTKFLEKRIKNLDKQLKLLELPIKASRTTPAATVKPPFEIGFNKQTITSALTGTWQWTSLSRIREESRPDPRGNGIKDVWEKDTPKDGIVDRIQIVKYPPNSGLLEPHQDPYIYQNFFISVYLSKKGEDYKEGGMYFINENKTKFMFDDLVDVGDMAYGFATLYHGVDISKTIEKTSNNDTTGRWFMGLYSTVSDYVENRHTGKPSKYLK